MIVRRRTAERLLALALPIPIAALLWLGPIKAYVDLVGSGSEQIASQAQVLRRYRSVLADPPEAASGTAAPGAGRLLAPELPEAQAIAQLQESIKKAAASDVEIRSLQVLPASDFSGTRRIAVRVAAVGEIAGLAKLLLAIEAARPLLYPDNLQVQARPATAGAKHSETLDFQFDVSAFNPGGSP